jgi:uncharacterized protein YraI
MTDRNTTFACLALAFAAVCGSAQAQSTYTATAVNMRAGPGGFYPVVTVLGPSLPVTVLGCIASYEWCDVSAGGARGWVWAGNINYVSSDGATSPLRNWAPARVQVEPFGVESYWNEHYRDRPWYGERRRWAQREMPVPGRRGQERRIVPQAPMAPPPGQQGPFLQQNP